MLKRVNYTNLKLLCLKFCLPELGIELGFSGVANFYKGCRRNILVLIKKQR